MNDSFFTLKEFRMNNHCPECYSNEGLVLTFKQRFVENAMYKAITSEMIHSLSCDNCNTEIFPVRWTDDIEQVVEYHIRATTPKSKSIKLKKTAWILIATILIIVLGGALFVGVFK